MSGGVCTMESSRHTTTKIASPVATIISDTLFPLIVLQLSGRLISAAFLEDSGGGVWSGAAELPHPVSEGPPGMVGQAVAQCHLVLPATDSRPRWWGGPPVRGRRPRRPARALQDAEIVAPDAGRGRPARTRGSAPPIRPSRQLRRKLCGIGLKACPTQPIRAYRRSDSPGRRPGKSIAVPVDAPGGSSSWVRRRAPASRHSASPGRP